VLAEMTPGVSPPARVGPGCSALAETGREDDAGGADQAGLRSAGGSSAGVHRAGGRGCRAGPR
jgi:hypothetical protein